MERTFWCGRANGSGGAIRKRVAEDASTSRAMDECRPRNARHTRLRCTTGEGEMVDVPHRSLLRHDHALPWAACFLDPEARRSDRHRERCTPAPCAHGRRAKVLESYRMTSQCASGSGQFLENISPATSAG